MESTYLKPSNSPAVRRRGLAILFLSLTFLALGLQKDHTVYLLAAAVFFVSGLVSLKSGLWGNRS
jgi:hypothetical protein